MAYYIYENWQAGPHKAIIHVGTCGCCKNGAGMAGGYNPAHASWHGAYDTLQEAEAASGALVGIMERQIHRCART